MFIIVITLLTMNAMSKNSINETIKSSDILIGNVSYSYSLQSDSSNVDTLKRLSKSELQNKDFDEFKTKELRQIKNLKMLENQNKMMDSLINKNDSLKKWSVTKKNGN